MTTSPGPDPVPQGAPDPEKISDPFAANPAAAILGAVPSGAETGAVPGGAAAARDALATSAVTLAQESTILAAGERDTYEESKHRQILGFRRWLVPGVFGLTLAWLIFVAFAIEREQNRHGLSDAVLIALLGTATATVLGLLVIVLKSLFPIELDREGE